MAPKLPNELMDAIMSSVSTTGRLSPEDKQTFRSCTLVCRDWLPASRYALLSDIALTTPTVWDSFLHWVVDAESPGRPWLASIHRLQLTDRLYPPLRRRREGVPTELTSEWRGQYLVPILAGHVPNLEVLSLCVDWDWCSPHPKTYGMFSQFTSLRELHLLSCRFPSFCTFRRMIVSLPALDSLTCDGVHWLSVPQPSILPMRSRRPALRSLRISFLFHSSALVILEWLINTPTRSTLIDWELEYPSLLLHTRQTLLDRTLDHYAQIFAPSIRRLSLGATQRHGGTISKISLSSFFNLRFLSLEVNGANWPATANILQPLPARLSTLRIDIFYTKQAMDGNRLVKEDGAIKAMKVNGLEVLDSLLSRDNFEDLSLLTFKLGGYRDTLPSYRERTREAIQRKLPTLHSRATLDIQLELVLFDRTPTPSPTV